MPLSYDKLYQDRIRPYFEKVPDSRKSNIRYSLSDTLSSCLAMFSLKCPSLLNYEQRSKQESSNIKEVYNLKDIPSDSQARNILDQVNPRELEGLFVELFGVVKRSGVLKGYRTLQGRLLVSIDGTGFFESKKVSCPYCLEKKHSNGSISCSHSLLSGVLVHPEKKEVFPLVNEAIVQQDGSTKNDCEINASKRLIQQLKSNYSQEKLLIVSDALYAQGVHISDLLEAHMDYIINVKPKGNPTLFSQFEARDQRGELKHKELKDKDGTVHSYSYANNLRLNSTHEIRCNMLVYKFTNKKGVTKSFSWITNIPLHARNVEQVMQAARARWKIENETFNTLKNQGYQLEHNYGHGKQYLANNFAVLMIIAFLIDQIQQAASNVFIKAWKIIGTKVKLWEVIRSAFMMKTVKSYEQALIIILAEYGIFNE